MTTWTPIATPMPTRCADPTQCRCTDHPVSVRVFAVFTGGKCTTVGQRDYCACCDRTYGQRGQVS